MDGFALLETLPPERMPVVTFTTAYDEHAVRAFKVPAFDDLLKPFDDPRFGKTLDRARKHLAAQNGNSDRLMTLLDDLRQVPLEEIDWVEAPDNYASLHVGSETHSVRETMNSFEGRFDGEKSLRIHQSTIVNADRIKELRPWLHGEYVVLLKDGTELTLSRTYREKILTALGT